MANEDDKNGQMGEKKTESGQMSELDQAFNEITSYVGKPYDPFAEHFYRANARGSLIHAIDVLKMEISVLKHDLRGEQSTVAMLKNDLVAAKEENKKLKKKVAENDKLKSAIKRKIKLIEKKLKLVEKRNERAKRKEQKRYFHEGPMRPMSREEIMAEDKKARVGFGLHGE